MQLDRTAPRDETPSPVPQPAIQAGPAITWARSATQTSPGTTDCGPSCAPVERSPPPAQTECPDGAGLLTIGLSLVSTARPHSAYRIGPRAARAYLQKSRSAFPTLLDRDWPWAIRSECPAVLKAAQASPPTRPAASYIR